jgi:hypothetical protein
MVQHAVLEDERVPPPGAINLEVDCQCFARGLCVIELNAEIVEGHFERQVSDQISGARLPRRLR